MHTMDEILKLDTIAQYNTLRGSNLASLGKRG